MDDTTPEQKIQQLSNQLKETEADLRQLTEDALFVAKNVSFPKQSPLWYAQQDILRRPDPFTELLKRHQNLAKKPI